MWRGLRLNLDAHAGLMQVLGARVQDRELGKVDESARATAGRAWGQ